MQFKLIVPAFVFQVQVQAIWSDSPFQQELNDAKRKKQNKNAKKQNKRKMGSSNSKVQAPKKADSVETFVENSSGTHFLEIHAPTAGVSFLAVFIAVVAVIFLYALYRKCHRLTSRRRHSRHGSGSPPRRPVGQYEEEFQQNSPLSMLLFLQQMQQQHQQQQLAFSQFQRPNPFPDQNRFYYVDDTVVQGQPPAAEVRGAGAANTPRGLSAPDAGPVQVHRANVQRVGSAAPRVTDPPRP